MFESLDVTDQTLAIYRALLQYPRLMQLPEQQMKADLAALTGVGEAEVRTEVDHLRELGLIVPRWNIEGQEYPLDPSVGFERLAGRQREKIDGLASALAKDELDAREFTADYREFLVQRTARDVELLEGREAA